MSLAELVKYGVYPPNRQPLLPTGNDDAALVQQYQNDMASSGLQALLGPGDFIIGSGMTWRSKLLTNVDYGQGIGLQVVGKGSGNTRLKYASSSTTTPMISINAPTSANIGTRNYMSLLRGLSCIRVNTNGSDLTVETSNGVGIYGAPFAATGEVFHTPKFNDIYFDGFDYPMTLSDCTLPEFDTCWWRTFLVGVRLGYNNDIINFNHCMFGSEQFSTNRNTQVAIQNGFSDGFNTPGGESIIHVSNTWFMKIGKAFEGAAGLQISGLHFDRAYFENVRRYLHAQATSGVTHNVRASFNRCEFSLATQNDPTQTNPDVAGYEARIQFDGDVATSSGATPYLSMRDNNAGGAVPTNAWISWNSRAGRIIWQNNAMLPSSSFGTTRCVRSGWRTWRTVPNQGYGDYSFGDSNAAGMGKMSGDPIEVTATIAAAATYNINTLNGDAFYLTLPDGDCTIDSLPYSTTPPSHLMAASVKAKIVLIVPSSVTATRTITWGARMKMNASTLTYAATDQNKRAVVCVEALSFTSQGLQLTGAAPAFVAVP